MNIATAWLRFKIPTLYLTALVLTLLLSFTPVAYGLEESTEGESQTPIPKSANLVTGMLTRGDPATVNITADQFSTKGSSSFDVYIHTTPVFLGTFTSDETGNLSFTLSIPDNLSPGYHTLHIYGPDTSGNQLDIQDDRVFVIASSDDYDGDGIPNDQDTCTVLPEDEQEFNAESTSSGCGSSDTKTPMQSSGGKAPSSSQVKTSTLLDPKLTNFTRSFVNLGTAHDNTPTNNEPTEQNSEVLSDQDVVVVKKAAEKPQKQTYEVSLIVALTAIVLLVAAGLAASKWYAKHSD